jgi:hypothetical protein
MPGITEHDMDSVKEAVSVLEDAGFTVDGLDDVERAKHGVRFSVSAVANTRTKPLEDSG